MGFIDMDALEKREMLSGLRARFVHTDNMTFSYWDIDAGAELPEHSHPHEQVANMLEGDFELKVKGESRRMKPGDVCVIPPDTPHSGKALTACRVLDVFYPVREDYK